MGCIGRSSLKSAGGTFMQQALLARFGWRLMPSPPVSLLPQPGTCRGITLATNCRPIQMTQQSPGPPAARRKIDDLLAEIAALKLQPPHASGFSRLSTLECA